jgi:hypothetical protein
LAIDGDWIAIALDDSAIGRLPFGEFDGDWMIAIDWVAEARPSVQGRGMPRPHEKTLRVAA